MGLPRILKGAPPFPTDLRIHVGAMFDKIRNRIERYGVNRVAGWYGISISDRLFIGVLRFDGFRAEERRPGDPSRTPSE